MISLVGCKDMGSICEKQAKTSLNASFNCLYYFEKCDCSRLEYDNGVYIDTYEDIEFYLEENIQ